MVSSVQAAFIGHSCLPTREALETQNPFPLSCHVKPFLVLWKMSAEPEFRASSGNDLFPVRLPGAQGGRRVSPSSVSLSLVARLSVPGSVPTKHL